MSDTAARNHDLALGQALASHRAGNLGAAESAYRTVLNVEPGHAAANHHLGVLLVQSGRMAEGLDRLKTALEKEAGEPLFYFSFAKGLLAAGDPAQAGAVLREAAQLGLDDRRFEPLKSEIRETAVRMYRRAVADHPGDPMALDDLGNALLMQGKTEEAAA